jgi:hypothetical protein
MPLAWARIDGKPSIAGALAAATVASMVLIALANRGRSPEAALDPR